VPVRLRSLPRAAALIALAACNGWGAAEQAAPPLPGPADWNRPVVPPGDSEAASARASCDYAGGSLPAETQGASYPSGTAIPIDHILVVMMENRSFDHYFQKLPERGQPDADVAPEGFTNPDSEGNPVGLFHQQADCFVDTDHSWAATAEQIGDGDMSGFVVTNEGRHENPSGGDLEMLAGRRAMGHYDEPDLPFYFWLANTFAIGNRYFASLPGPTFPNRMYLYAASSFGAVHNTIPGDAETIVDLLEKRQVSWRIYASSSPGLALFLSKVSLFPDHVFPIAQYFADAAAGTLPAFAFVDPAIGLATGQVDTNDEHPPALAKVGQRFVAEVVDALTRSPNWPRSALFLTYDEHGGLYDHVPPPRACPPDEHEPELEQGDPAGRFDRLGLRVPFIVVSPYAKSHHVGHQIYDHTSILRFIEARFVMPALSRRDANALAPWDMFDFASPPREAPAVPLPPQATAELEACAAIFE
jgi:phospholipase C